MKISCNCQYCKSACLKKPGWFLPHQVEDLLKYFQVDNIRDLLETSQFAIDWWEGDDDNILVLAPNIIDNDDIQYPANPHGRCVFYKNNKCSIYEIRLLSVQNICMVILKSNVTSDISL